jgi:hypothetical protein
VPARTIVARHFRCAFPATAALGAGAVGVAADDSIAGGLQLH